MTIDLDLGGRRFRATLSPLDGLGEGRGRVRIDLRAVDEPCDHVARTLDVRATAHGYMMIDVDDGRVVDAAITPIGRDRWSVQLPDVDVDVVVGDRAHLGAAATDQGSGEHRVVAPMPGRIVRILVGVGEAVVAGQSLVVVEAMKMENALTALRDGVVQEISCEEGVAVEAGHALLVVG